MAQEARSVVRQRLDWLKQFAPHVATRNGLEEADVTRFHDRIREAEAAMTAGDWGKAHRAATDSWLGYFVNEVLVAQNRVLRRVLLAGPFPLSGCPELEQDVFGRKIESKPYSGSTGWRHVEFGRFIGTPDRAPLDRVAPDHGEAVAYLTTFLYTDFPKTANPPGFEEGSLTIRLAGAPVKGAWVWGEEVRPTSGEPAEITIRRPGGWWWLLLKVRVRAGTQFVRIEYFDESGKPLEPERGEDRHGFTGIYVGEKVARLALWAPRELGSVRQKLTLIRAWFERLERTIGDYVELHNELPETSPNFDPAAAERWQRVLRERFPDEESPLALRNPFSDTGSARTYGAAYFDYQLHSGGRRFRTKSLRVVVTGPLPLDTWAVYDPAKGPYSPGQIFFAIYRPDIDGHVGRGAVNWVRWCANWALTSFEERARRTEVRKSNRFSTYELLPQAR